MHPYLVVFVTAPSKEHATQIAETLLDQRLAACVNVVDGVHSHYVWQGKIAHDHEVLLIIKTRGDVFAQLTAAIKAQHPYQVPEIIGLPIVMGDEDYLAWLDESLTQAHSK